MQIIDIHPIFAQYDSKRKMHASLQVVSILMAQKDSGFKSAPVLKALRSAAVMALPPNASKEGVASEDGTDSEEAVRFILLRGQGNADDVGNVGATFVALAIGQSRRN